MEVGANMDVGGYCWARYGFCAKIREVESLFTYDNRVQKIISDYKKENPIAELFPMNEIAKQTFGKEVLLNSSWHGILDLTDKISREYFENYISFLP